MKETYQKVHSVLKGARSWPWFAISIVAMVVMIVLFIRLRYTYIQQIEEKQFTIAALTDTLKTERKESGEQKATITAFQGTKVKYILQIKSGDSTIRRLQSLLGGYSKTIGQGSAAVFTANTNISTTTKTVITPGDTVRRDSLVYVFPEYKSKFALGKWVSGSVAANKDSTAINIRTYNEYDVVIGEGNRGWFRKSKPFADVITYSPYDSISKLRAMNVIAPPQKKIGLGLQVGYGYTLATRLERVVYVGVGLSYNVINVR